MTNISRMALIAVTAAGLATTPSAAQSRKEKAAAAAAEAAKQPKLSKAVQAVLVSAQKAQQANDHTTALADLQKAEALPNRTADDNYFINALKLNSAIATNNNALMETALEGALASGKVPAAEQPKYVRNLYALASQRGDTAKASRLLGELAAASPNDPQILLSMAEQQNKGKDPRAAIGTFNKAIAAQKAAGQPVPEQWYRRMLAIAYDAKLPAEVQSSSVALVQAYPTPTNWRDALIIYRDNARFDDQGNLDIMRLMRSAGALNGERDYADYAETASGRGLPGEAKAVLDEGVAKGMLSSSKPVFKELAGAANSKVGADRAALPSLDRDARKAASGKAALATADAYLGYGQDAKAAELYRIALEKGGVDASMVNTRLGIALARSGDKAGAQAAFALVQGPRTPLAQYWTIWLGQRA